MSSAVDYVVRKVPEMLLLAVVIGLMYVWGASSVSLYSVSLIFAVVLATYDMPLVLKGMQAIREKGGEIFAMSVLLIAFMMWNTPMDIAITLLAAAFLLMLVLNNKYLQRGVLQGTYDILTQPKVGILLGVVLTLMIVWAFAIETMLLMLLFLSFLLYRWESRVIATLALVSIATCPLLLILGLNTHAEQMAVYAYLLLVITVALQLVEFWREK